MLKVIILIAGIANFFLGYIAWKKSPKGKINIFFGLLGLSTSAWAIFNFLFEIFQNITLLRSAYAFGALVPTIGLFWLLFLGKNVIRKKVLPVKILVVCVGIFLFIASYVPDFIVTGEYNAVLNIFKVETGPFYYIYSVLAFILIFALLVVTFFIHSRAEGIIKNQLKYVLIGVWSFSLTALFVSFILPLFGYIGLAKLDSPSSLLFVGFSTYAIIKHRFLDIRFVLRKSFIYVGLAIFVFLAYYFSLWVDNAFFSGSYSIGGYLSAIIIAPLFLFGFSYISRFLKYAANKYFFTGLYDSQSTIKQFADRISQTIRFDEVSELILDTIQNTLRPDAIALVIKTNNKSEKEITFSVAQNRGFDTNKLTSLNRVYEYLSTESQLILTEETLNSAREVPELSKILSILKDTSIQAFLPLKVKDNVNSIVILGRKATKEAYTKEDVELLTTLSNQASVAIENARLYRQVQDFNQTLQAKVNDQTKEIREKNVNLEKLLKSQSEFLDIASHQLRTPVSLIKGITTMILEGDMDKLPKEKKDEFLRAIVDKSGKLEIIINDILSASEFDSQKFAARPNSPHILLEDVVDAAVQDAQAEAKQRNIELKWQKPIKPLPKIIGEEKYLEQALYNLVSNALKYTPSTEMVKEARAQREIKGVVEVAIGREKNDVIVSVKDNGIGIPQKEINKLFKKFARASNATAMYTDGSGLGLFIVKEIIEGHKGKVWVESEIDKGSTFYVSLPIAA